MAKDDKVKDIAPELLEKIRKEFEEEYQNSSEIKRITKTINLKTATYKEANEYAIEVGKILSNSYQHNLSSNVLPNGKMYYNIAKRVLEPTMEDAGGIIWNVAKKVQETLNSNANIGIKAQPPPSQKNKIKGIVDRISSEDKYDNVSWILNEPVKTYAQSIVDDTIEVNAKFQYKSGIKVKIVRKIAGNCCSWCQAVAGVYAYPDVPKDVYRRHQRCRCTVECYPGNGTVQNVHDKSVVEIQEDIQRREVVGKSKTKAKNVTAEYYGLATPKKGEIVFEGNYKKSLHKNEMKIATVIHNMFGGDIVLLEEINENNTQTADFLWRGKHWELKTPSSEKAAEGLVRKALKQIYNNPGGIILNYLDTEISVEKLLTVIDPRMERSAKQDTDIMIVLKEEEIKVYRYKK